MILGSGSIMKMLILIIRLLTVNIKNLQRSMLYMPKKAKIIHYLKIYNMLTQKSMLL